jgi:AraC-like DNA-binding protein
MDTCYSLQHFSDADEHAQTLANFGQSYFQIGKGPFQSTLQQVALDGLHVFSESANRLIVECGHVLPGSIALGWIAPASGPDRRAAMPMGISRGGDDWMFRLPSQLELIGVTMQADEFDSLVEPLGLAMTGHANHIRLMRGSIAFLELCSCIGEMGVHAQRLERADIRAALRQQLLDGIFCALGESEASPRASLTQLTYGDIVKRSQDLVLENPESPLTVLDLCTRLRASRRTLQKSFLQVTGESPSSYLRRIRLGGVRRLLRSIPADQMNIGDAAARWGFFHLGNFASDYRQLFGELPSQTARFGIGPGPQRTVESSHAELERR